MTDPAGDVLLLVESGIPPYREHVLRSLAPHHRLWLLAATAPDWQRPYLAGHTVVDTRSVAATIAAAREVAASRGVTGLLCYDELRIVPAARVARALGLPTAAPDALRACRDKHLGRQLLAAAEVPQPPSLLAADLTAATAAAEAIGYPVIVKPRGLAGSTGVCLAREPDELPAAVAVAGSAHFPGEPRFAQNLLVEEYLTGPEISVDAVVWDARARPVIVAHKSQDLAPTFEETGHLVRGDEPLLADPAVREIIDRAHRALGLTHGVTHTELRLTSDGPRVVEVNGRLGGDMIPYLGWLATGIDLAIAAAELACGRRPELLPTRNCVAAIRWLYPPHDLCLRSIHIEPSALPPGIWEMRPIAGPGQQLALPPRSHVFGRLALAIAVSADPASCRAALAGAAAALQIQSDPDITIS